MLSRLTRGLLASAVYLYIDICIRETGVFIQLCSELYSATQLYISLVNK